MKQLLIIILLFFIVFPITSQEQELQQYLQQFGVDMEVKQKEDGTFIFNDNYSKTSDDVYYQLSLLMKALEFLEKHGSNIGYDVDVNSFDYTIENKDLELQLSGEWMNEYLESRPSQQYDLLDKELKPLIMEEPKYNVQQKR